MKTPSTTADCAAKENSTSGVSLSVCEILDIRARGGSKFFRKSCELSLSTNSRSGPSEPLRHNLISPKQLHLQRCTFSRACSCASLVDPDSGHSSRISAGINDNHHAHADWFMLGSADQYPHRTFRCDQHCTGSNDVGHGSLCAGLGRLRFFGWRPGVPARDDERASKGLTY